MNHELDMEGEVYRCRAEKINKVNRNNNGMECNRVGWKEG